MVINADSQKKDILRVSQLILDMPGFGFNIINYGLTEAALTAVTISSRRKWKYNFVIAVCVPKAY